MSLNAFQRSVLDRYEPAILGAVTAIHDMSDTGGLSFLVDGVEHRYRLPLKDLASLRDDLTAFIAAHLSRRVQRAGSADAAGTPQTSASSTAASTAWRSE